MNVTASFILSIIAGLAGYFAGVILFTAVASAERHGRLSSNEYMYAIYIGIGVFVLSMLSINVLNFLFGNRSSAAVVGGLIGLMSMPNVMGPGGGLFAIFLAPPLIYLFDKYNPSLPDPDLKPVVSLLQGMVVGGIIKQAL